MFNITFSIITPCYKGKNFLPRAYSSILRQGREFNLEWIIVDDFSNDNGATQAVIEKIKSESPFPINAIYLEKNHYGARSAYTGAIHAKGEYSIILDQDDMLADDALEIFSAYISNYQSLHNFAGVCGRCVSPDGRLIGTPFRWEEKLSNELRIRYIEKIRGEMFQCTKTKLIAEYFYGMKPGYTNGWAWSRIAKNYEYLYTNKIVRIYNTANPESMSNLKRLVHLDAQFEQSTEFLVGNADDYLVHDQTSCIRMLIQWARVGLHLNKKYTELSETLPRSIRGLFRLAFPVALIKAKRDRMIGAI
jgi:glycosyltransferase involved in cell wall biosynthesis